MSSWVIYIFTVSRRQLLQLVSDTRKFVLITIIAVQMTKVDGLPMFSVTFKQKPSQFSPVHIATILYRKMMGLFIYFTAA